MKHRIDPKIDCVFKTLLGTEANSDLLIHFLNSILTKELPKEIVEVEIINPYNNKEFISDKLSIVDIKAKDDQKRMYQIEIQLSSYQHLSARIVYGWTDLYSQQLTSGQDYSQLTPTYSVWLLAEELFAEDKNYVHDYQLRNKEGQVLLKHGGIWLFELSKFVIDDIATEEHRWLKFFREGEQLDDDRLPDWMNTNEMRKAMDTLRRFSEKEEDYYTYQARQNYLREQVCIRKEQEELRQQLEAELFKERWERELERREKEQERREKELERQQKEAALAEIERLNFLLSKMNQ